MTIEYRYRAEGYPLPKIKFNRGVSMKTTQRFPIYVCILLGLLLSSSACGKDLPANIVHVTEKAELDKILKADKKVLVDFYADWCGPCVKLAPELKALAKEDKTLKIVKINVDKAKKLSEEYKIESIPSLFVFKDGKKVSSSNGFMNKEKLKAFVSGSPKTKSGKACCPGH
jgi:thioredoxin 1